MGSYFDEGSGGLVLLLDRVVFLVGVSSFWFSLGRFEGGEVRLVLVLGGSEFGGSPILWGWDGVWVSDGLFVCFVGMVSLTNFYFVFVIFSFLWFL